MQRPPPNIPENITVAAANWLKVAIQNNDFFTDPKKPVGGRLFDVDFNYENQNIPEIQKAGAEINGALALALKNSDDKNALLNLYPALMDLGKGMGTNLNKQNFDTINEYKQLFLNTLLTNSNFKEVWDSVKQAITRKIDQEIANSNDSSEKIAALQQQKQLLIHDMEMKLMGGLIYKIQGAVTKAWTADKRPEMDRADYLQLIKGINAYDSARELEEQRTSHIDRLKGEFSPNHAITYLETNKQANLDSTLQNFKVSLTNLYLFELNAPKNKSHAFLGEFGKATINKLLITYVEAIKNAKGDSATKEKYLQEASEAIAGHLIEQQRSSTDPKTLATAKKLANIVTPYLPLATAKQLADTVIPYLSSNKVEFNVESKKLARSEGNRDLKSSTAIMFNATSSPEELEKMRKREADKEEARKDPHPHAPLRMQLAKREPLKPKHDALAPNAPQATVSAKNTAEAPTLSTTRKP